MDVFTFKAEGVMDQDSCFYVGGGPTLCSSQAISKVPLDPEHVFIIAKVIDCAVFSPESEEKTWFLFV